jgi:AraC-like DNA-binding protein
MRQLSQHSQHIHIDNADEFTEMVDREGWQSRVHQTAPGTLGLDLSLHRSEHLTAWRSQTRAATIREMRTPENHRTFGLFIPDCATNSWCHRNFDCTVLMKMPLDGYATANKAGYLGYQLAFDDQLVGETLQQLELPDRLGDNESMLELEPVFGERVGNTIDALWNSSDPNPVAQISESLLATFLSSFCVGAPGYRNRARQRCQAFHRAREYMHAHLGDAITLADVCRYIGASRRSVTDAFRESLGLSPMAYLKILRLNKVRTSLADVEDGGLLITDIANEAGFWHMGQLAADYRKLFGELPSETVARRMFKHSKAATGGI